MSAASANANSKAALERWEALMPIPCVVAVEAAVTGFTVGDLLALSAGSVVRTAHKQNAPVRVFVEGQQIAAAEFEVVSDRLAVRLTELT